MEFLQIAKFLLDQAAEEESGEIGEQAGLATRGPTGKPSENAGRTDSIPQFGIQRIGKQTAHQVNAAEADTASPWACAHLPRREKIQ